MLPAPAPRTPFAHDRIFAKQIIGNLDAVIARHDTRFPCQQKVQHRGQLHLVFPRNDYQILREAKGEIIMRKLLSLAGILGVSAAAMLWWQSPQTPLSAAEFAAHYARPLPAPPAGLSVYHLGHSLVGRDMPAMLAQVASHEHASQLGWGAALKAHWTGTVPGFAEENGHPRFRPAHEAIDSGDYDVVVLTEMVEIRDAIRYFDSPDYLARWAARIRAARPEARIYLYETWHRLDDPEGWLNRLDRDLGRHWEGNLLRRAKAGNDIGTVHVIPGGQVMAAVVRAAEAGQIPGLTDRRQLFAQAPDGTTDTIHFNDIGAWLMAMTHYATIYQRSPEGLPHNLLRADGTMMAGLAPDTATALQRIVWSVVTRYPATGVPQSGANG